MEIWLHSRVLSPRFWVQSPSLEKERWRINNYKQSSHLLNKKNACLKVGPFMSGLYLKLSADIPLQYKGEKSIEIQHLPFSPHLHVYIVCVLCEHVCMCVDMYAYTFVCLCMWRPKVDGGNDPQSLFYLMHRGRVS